MHTAVNAIWISWMLDDDKSLCKVATNRISSSLPLSRNNEQHKYPSFFKDKIFDWVRLTAWMCAKLASWL